MTGLLLLFVVGIWFTFALWLSSKLTRSLQPGTVKKITHFLLFLLLLVAPVADEIIGGFQFRSLCGDSAMVKVDEEKAKGKTVKLKLSDGKNVDYKLVNIREQTWNYLDIQNNEILISYKTLHAKGGWLIKALGISETNSPLTFRHACGPTDAKTIFGRLNIQISYK